jgi:hypothetical protein
LIHRSEFAGYYEVNSRNFKEKEHLYKRSQTIVEHPYGTIKRQWGFSYILTKKGIARASSDVGFMMIAYNLRRIGNILTRDQLKEYLRMLVSVFFDILGFCREKISLLETFFSGNIFTPGQIQPSLKSYQIERKNFGG